MISWQKKLREENEHLKKEVEMLKLEVTNLKFMIHTYTHQTVIGVSVIACEKISEAATQLATSAVQYADKMRKGY